MSAESQKRRTRLKKFLRSFFPTKEELRDIPKVAGIMILIFLLIIVLNYFATYLGNWVVQGYFPETINTSNAIEIFKALASLDGVLIGFIALVTATALSDIDRRISELQLKRLNHSYYQYMESVIEEELRRTGTRRIYIALFDVTVILLLLTSIITSFISIAQVPLDESVKATRIPFVYPFGWLLTAIFVLGIRLTFLGTFRSTVRVAAP